MVNEMIGGLFLLSDSKILDIDKIDRFFAKVDEIEYICRAI